MFEGNENFKVEGRSLVESLWVGVGTELGPSYLISVSNYFGKLER